MLIDTHAHLHVREFDHDREEVIERAQNAGITKIINVGFDVEGNFQAIALAKKYDFIYATMGIHPHLASDWNDDVAAKILETAKKEEKVIALGEMGLDYYRNLQPPELQKRAFREQLKIAKKLSLPVIIHCRYAFKDLYNILDEEKIERALLHCFTGTLEEAEQGLRRGYFIAFTGIITYASAHELRYVVQKTPLDRIFIETDCPYLAPQKYRGRRNEPSFIPEIAKKLTDIKQITNSVFSDQVMENYRVLFNCFY